jgi:hypothetical protein
MSSEVSNNELINFIGTLSKNLSNLENVLNDRIDKLSLPSNGSLIIGFEKNGDMEVNMIIDKLKNHSELKTEKHDEKHDEKGNSDIASETSINNLVSESSVDNDKKGEQLNKFSETSSVNNDNVIKGGSSNNFSETSSVNGSFLNRRMNKFLRNSMNGGGRNSDTLASITELQRDPMPKYNSQNGGGNNMSKNDFLKKMRDAGITSSTSEFC